MTVPDCCNIECALCVTEKADPECIRRANNLLLGRRIDSLTREVEALTKQLDKEICKLPTGTTKDALCDATVLLAQGTRRMLDAYMETRK